MKVKSVADVYCSYLDDIERLEKENKKLKERLADADKALKAMDEKYGLHYLLPDDKGNATVKGNSPAWKYMLKWGLK